jgi:hypothetical protein
MNLQVSQNHDGVRAVDSQCSLSLPEAGFLRRSTRGLHRPREFSSKFRYPVPLSLDCV